MQIEKVYEPQRFEPHWADWWIQSGIFQASAAPSGSVFSLVIPPPNVTGSLHIGHMLEHTEIDVTIRWRRMSGDNTLWLPGTDHAGIATQMVVARKLAEEGINYRDLGREKFEERVWQWKAESGDTIKRQMVRLGASCDWSRERFTLDPGLSRAVREVFVRLYEKGLIYRGEYMVNWCPHCGTAISDLEVAHSDEQGHLWHIRYPVNGMQGRSLVVATTRPETMLGDTAVAVNPNDPRYRNVHGQTVQLPLMNREIPVILDELADPEFGTGVVKVTPAHDPNDFEAGRRHNLPKIQVIANTGIMTKEAGPYAGLDRFEARRQVVAHLQEQGVLVKVEDYPLSVGKCARCKTVVEPLISTQWFVKTKPLAEKAIAVVESGRIQFVPAHWSKTYFEWMYNIRDWCISRQLWWGHRIPAWHCPECHEIIVARETPATCSRCGAGHLEQDTDVLDTWFSSGLLPFTTLGWPEKTRDQEVFYPTTLLITAYEILFFWVARMIMFGCHFMDGHHQDAALKAASCWGAKKDDSVPFRRVYIHALVRDAERQKMSKTKGNVVDPIEVIEKYGTDATRFTLAAMSSPGTDIAFNPSRTDGYRAFANKIWNAARFMFMNLDRVAPGFTPGANGSDTRPQTGIPGFEAKTLEDRWILSRFNRVAQQVHESLDAYRFDNAATSIYDFFWGEFCDWYIELVKPRLADGADKETARIACRNLVSLFEASLRLLHPVMPFITEEIWQAIYDGKPPLKSIALACYPTADQHQVGLQAEADMAILQDLIVSVRNLRAELKVEQKLRVPIQVFAEDTAVRALIEHNQGAVERLANVQDIMFVKESLAKLAGARHTARFDVHVVYEKPIDVATERERLRKELERIEREIANGQRQLSNEQFLAKAPADVVEGLRRRARELEVLRDKTRSKLGELR